MNTDIHQLIENLIFYAVNELKLCFEDSVYARNQLLSLFKTDFKFSLSNRAALQEEILEPMLDYAASEGLYAEGERLLFETKIMGLVTPAPGEVIEKFRKLAKDSAAATKYLYDISVKNNYIRMCDIKKNIRWTTSGEHGNIGITINLAKPEKDAKQIAAEKEQSGMKYPQCMLCVENLGFSGSLTHPARQTLRYVPVTMGGQNWYLQYSPYVYYDEHCIAFSASHSPMAVTGDTFLRLLDFVEQFPFYFMGSNADLPIVGGSILSHDHYQGGKKVLPMLSRPFKKTYEFATGAVVGILDWYNSVIRICSSKKYLVLDLATKVAERWRAYSDEDNGIYAYTNAPHNTVTPIASVNEKGEYCIDIILRNNRTDDKHPYGIYHPTEDMHNIKKEGIGLIEAMGLFILPGRLKREISLLIDILSSGRQPAFAALNDDKDMSKHIGMIAQLAQQFGTGLSRNNAQTAIINYINETCAKILECTAVYKNTREGEAAFDRFIIHTKKKYGIFIGNNA